MRCACRAFGRPGDDLLSHALRRSTIGAKDLHGRVRDGIGCYTLAIATRSFKCAVVSCVFAGVVHRVCRYAWRAIKPIELLVPVSFTRHRASTPGLSTWWSSTALIGRTGFEGGFPLRCFQRLSLPYIATRRCGWRHNRYTRGTSTPVLSY